MKMHWTDNLGRIYGHYQMALLSLGIFAGGLSAFAQVTPLTPHIPYDSRIPTKFQKYMEKEQSKYNSHFRKGGAVSSDVNSAYMPFSKPAFELPYVQIPVEDQGTLHIVDRGASSESVKSQIYTEKDGKKYFRFFIHPESAKLYKPLVAKYGLAGHYLATPTSSTRTLLAWDPSDPENKNMFVKLSVDKIQYGWGRAVPDHEVRRSVLASGQIAKMDASKKNKFGLEVMPEVIGAYVDQSEKMSAWIHRDQGGHNSQHGMVIRESGDLFNDLGDQEIYPTFALFSERENNQGGLDEPVIISMWKASGVHSFVEFITNNFLEPVIKGTSYMTMVEGMLPEMHSQNFLVQVSPSENKVTKVIHRDVGGLRNVDLELRLAQGLDTSELQSGNTEKDFRFAKATKEQRTPYSNWLFPFLFGDYRESFFGNVLKKYVPHYERKKMEGELQTAMNDLLKKYARIHFGEGAQGKTLSDRAQNFIANQLNKILPSPGLTDLKRELIAKFIELQKVNNQVLKLEHLKLDRTFGRNDYQVTPHGVIYSGGKGVKLVRPPFSGENTICQNTSSANSQQVQILWNQIKDLIVD